MTRTVLMILALPDGTGADRMAAQLARVSRRAMGKQARALALERYDRSALATRFVDHVESVLSLDGS